MDRDDYQQLFSALRTASTEITIAAWLTVLFGVIQVALLGLILWRVW
jgi:hypothetical protein